MNITFLIGNGFDINMGLATQFSDFLDDYLVEEPTDSESVRQFKQDIRKRELEDEQTQPKSKLWANAEMAFGEYTDTVFKQHETANAFCERHMDFCKKLARYLQAQEERIKTEGMEQDFIDALQNFRYGLSAVQREQVEASAKAFGGNYTFNFIIFNYTEVIDELVGSIKEGKGEFGKRIFGNSSNKNSIGTVVHVHGTTRREMVLGVNDVSQVKNTALFEGTSPAYINSFIKPQTNKWNESKVDEQTHQLLKSSDLIYIYGMSLGDTDTIWWQRIISSMKNKVHLRVLIYAFDAPRDPLVKTERWLYDATLKQKFLSFSKEQTDGLENRIHVISEDIFSEFSGIAAPLVEKENKEESNVVALPLSS